MPDLETQPEIQSSPDQTPPAPAAPEVQTENQPPAPVEPISPIEESQAAKPVNSPAVQPTEAPVEAKPAPAAAPVEPVQIEKPNKLTELLIKAKEKIQFRKRAKLEKIISLAQTKAAAGAAAGAGQAGQGKITNNDVQKLLRVSDATATRYLAELVREGRLRRVGPANNAFYQLAPPAGG